MGLERLKIEESLRKFPQSMEKLQHEDPLKPMWSVHVNSLPKMALQEDSSSSSSCTL